jgi:hypothetical protein
MKEYRNNPEIWEANCHQLLDTLVVIEKGILSSSDQEIHSVSLSAMMIVGFAFENAFKSWYLKEEKGILYDEEGNQKGFSTHAYTTWIAQHRIELLGWESEALAKAEFICVAWGRYPAHNKKEKERKHETWGMNDVNQLKNLIDRLLDRTVTCKNDLNYS